MTIPAPGALAAGLWAAARAPLWLRGGRLRELMAPPESPPAPRPVPRGAVGAAARAVAVLGRVPGLPWRNTCLYYSVAECLVLRRYGVAAVLRIGVRGGGGAGGAIAAHAWVARPGEDGAEPAPGPHELSHTLFSLR